MARALSKILLLIYIVLLATVPESLTFEGKNYLLIGFSLLGGILLAVLNAESFPSMRHDWLLAMLIYFVFISVINNETAQPLSLIYSIFFVGSYIFYYSFAKQLWSIDGYRRILRFMFLLFLVGLLIGQLVVYLNFFIPIQQLSLGTLHGGFHSILENGGYRFYSFSSEPSYAAFIVITLYYSYISTDPQKLSLFKGDNLLLFLILTYMLVMFKSGYGIVLLGMIVIKYFGLNKKALAAYAIFFVLGFIFVKSVPNFGPLYRINNLIRDTDFTNLHTIQVIDFNVYVRVAPVLHYIKTHPLSEMSLYFGNGAGASKAFIIPEIYAAYKGDFLGGFIPAFLYDYGIFGAAFVLLFIRSLLPRGISVPAVIVLLLLFNANINTQLFWFVLFCFSLNKNFERRSGVDSIESNR